MTYNQLIDKFSDIASAHKQIHTFATGELWEVEGILKPSIIHPIWFAVPTQSEMGEQTVTRSFTWLVFSKINKDKSDEQEILSDTELIMQDLIKIFRNEDHDYFILDNPIMFPFKEEFGDWCAGWRCEVRVETNGRDNYCDVPMDVLT